MRASSVPDGVERSANQIVCSARGQHHSWRCCPSVARPWLLFDRISRELTAKSQQSNAKSITKQLPFKIAYLSLPVAPNGIGPIQIPVNQNVVLLNGTVQPTNQCGVYRKSEPATSPSAVGDKFKRPSSLFASRTTFGGSNRLGTHPSGLRFPGSTATAAAAGAKKTGSQDRAERVAVRFARPQRCHMPGKRPGGSFILPIRFPSMPPPVMDFIILRAWAYCFNKAFTSCTDAPAPFAIRRRRAPLIIM